MSRLIPSITVALAMLLPAGCCTQRDPDTDVSIESYKRVLRQTRENLVDDVRPGYEEALRRSDLLPATFDARLGVVDDTVRLIDGALAGSQEGQEEDGE